MNRRQLRETLRSAYLDDTAEPYLWSDELLNTFIEEAHQEAAIRSLMVRNLLQIDIVSGQSEYIMSDQVLKIERVRLNGIYKLVSQTTTAELDESGKWESRSGVPEFFTFTSSAFGGDGILTLYPSPNLNIVASAIARELPTPMANDNAIPSLPSHLHLHLLDWCAFRAFTLRDSEANNEMLATKYEQTFEKHFGERHSADAMRDRNDKRKHRTKINRDYWS